VNPTVSLLDFASSEGITLDGSNRTVPATYLEHCLALSGKPRPVFDLLHSQTVHPAYPEALLRDGNCSSGDDVQSRSLTERLAAQHPWNTSIKM
jgi:hypothetical protein